MGVQELRDELIRDVQTINATHFTHQITKTTSVPVVDDPAITYPNLADRTQKSKLLTSAVLFVDMRGSTAMSMNHEPEVLVPIYSSFVRAMSECSHFYGGYTRNIIGDRLMVVFDRKDCFSNAIKTAILMNSVVQYVLKQQISKVNIKAGIGIDFGPMLVTKTGVIKHGDENDNNKSLVWLGKPANVASKLTDVANKPNGVPVRQVKENHYYSYNNSTASYTFNVDTFLDFLKMEKGRFMHDSTTIIGILKVTWMPPTNPPILFTKYFYDHLAKEAPDLDSVKGELWKEQSVKVPGYPNKIYGGDVVYTLFKE